jgi:hypothetical protein
MSLNRYRMLRPIRTKTGPDPRDRHCSSVVFAMPNFSATSSVVSKFSILYSPVESVIAGIEPAAVKQRANHHHCRGITAKGSGFRCGLFHRPDWSDE